MDSKVHGGVEMPIATLDSAAYGELWLIHKADLSYRLDFSESGISD